MKKIIPILLLILLAASLVIVPAVSHAQTQGAGYNSSVSNTQRTNDISYWWLLPILAIPLIIYAASKTSDESDSYTPNQKIRMVGTKGGRSRSQRNNYDINMNREENTNDTDG